MNTTEILLIDLSSLAYPIYKLSSGDPNPNAASVAIVARVRALASQHAHAAICCDTGRTFRHDLSAEYKRNRPERDEVLHHQIALTCEQLKTDGFPIWAAPGFEADDVIASATHHALAIDGVEVVIVSADKDILQLVGPRVSVKSVKDGARIGADEVAAKFGVRPEQMRDYLSLVGDAADNIKGANGIGEKKAAELLARFGSLDAVYEEIASVGATAAGIGLGMMKALSDFQPRKDEVRQLITLRTDAPVAFETILADRVAQPLATPSRWMRDTPEVTGHENAAQPVHQGEGEGPSVEAPQPAAPAAPVAAPAPVRAETRMAVATPARIDVLAPAPAEWERQLDPRSMHEARDLALDMANSRLFSDYGSPEGVLSTIMVGRELGLPAMASLRSIHVIEGKHSLSAALMVALVLHSKMAEFFEPVEFDDTKATFECQRVGARRPVKLTYTIEMAQKAGLVKPNSNWAKNPMAMCMARAQAMLCRLVFPDLLAGLYTPEELEEIRESRRAA